MASSALEHLDNAMADGVFAAAACTQQDGCPDEAANARSMGEAAAQPEDRMEARQVAETLETSGKPDGQKPRTGIASEDESGGFLISSALAAFPEGKAPFRHDGVAAAAPGRPVPEPAGADSARQPAPSTAASTAAAAFDPGYSYPQFVERFKHPSAQPVVNEVRDFVNDFPANLTRPQSARRIHSFLSDVTPRLLLAEAFREDGGAAADVRELAEEGLEKFVVLKLYKLLFRHAPADLREDERVEKCIRAASAKGSPLDVLGKLRREHREVLEAAALELQKVDQYRAPRDKSSCLVNAFRFVEGVVVEEVFHKGGHDTPGSDSALLGKLLTALLVKASPPNLYSNIEFTAAFRHPARMTADDKRSLAELARALLSLTGGGGPRLAAAELVEESSSRGPAAITAGSGATTSEEDIPLWLVDAGVTFHFEDRSANDLLIDEVEELMEEYQRMARTLHELVQVPAR
ncbi:unnamed protein product [Polarella glacialis]|uniref:VPS9 domain-containing protein n=1 Tax=Polarella glacialis TaxID=89957 RepID=A0A813LMA3_POLGL|nr:unnamed protein product [Polarella glacialis]